MINVKCDYGARGDGVTDDTVAIQEAINAASAKLAAGGNPGPVYFPPSSGFYKVSSLHIPGTQSGWLTLLFDNGLYITGTISVIWPACNIAFIGRTSNSAGLTGSFVWGPNVAWQKMKGSAPGPVVDLQGTDQIYFEGINFSNNSYDANNVQVQTAVHMHNDPTGRGCVWTTFRNCVFIPDLLIDYVPPNNAGFGLRMEGCSVQGKLSMAFYGMIVIRDSFVKQIICEPGGGGVGDILLENILSESLNGVDFFTWNGGDRLVMNFVSVADSVNSYLIKLVNRGPGTWTPTIKATFCQPGNGILNPASIGANPAILAEGDYMALDAVSGILYSGVHYGPKTGLKVYGSQWLTKPFQVINGTL